MNSLPIYTQTTDCQDCYRCIRECPLKAIKVTNHKASLIEDQCIFCGHCVLSCPTGAKKVRNDVGEVKRLLKKGMKVLVSLAPSWISEFPNLTAPQLITAIQKLGFSEVSETALGAQIVSHQTIQYLKGRTEGIYISSACPSVVELIRKYYPQHTLSITPFMSPLLTHAKMLKSHKSEEVAVVFVGPCIAKKKEADEFPHLLDAVITFKDLKEWFESEGIDPTSLPKNRASGFYPEKAHDGVLYPIDGGMLGSIKKHEILNGITFMSFSGQKQVTDALTHLDKLHQNRPVFLELLTCEGGCINGPGVDHAGGFVHKRLEVIQHFQSTPSVPSDPGLPPVQLKIERDFFGIQPIEETAISEAEIKEALKNIGKLTPHDELNCSGCGYNTCRDFAKALLNGKAEPAMCVSYMRKVAHNQATILLQKIPSGAIVVDDTLHVVEMNASCAKMLGPEIEMIFEATPGLKGADISKLGGLGEFFKTALYTGKEYKEITILENNEKYQLSIFHIQKHKLVTGILQNINHPKFNHQIIEKRTREVIRKNMETVQKIAVLLGENASTTDSLLNSILSDQKEEKSAHWSA